jgi:DNA-binding GntR family transcriptional regulator
MWKLPRRMLTTMNDLDNWMAVLSPTAKVLWALIGQPLLPKSAEVTMGELVKETGKSKTAIRAAIAELEEHGFILVIEG